MREFPESYPGLVQRAQDAFEAGEAALAQQLIIRSEELDRRRPEWERYLPGGAVYDLKQDLDRYGTLLAALRPVATAAGRPELLKGIPPAGDAAARAADRLCAALPDRTAEVLLALLPGQGRRVPWSADEVALRFLREFPDHPQAAGVWAYVPRTASAPDVVAAYVNRGPNAPNAAAALTGLGRVLGTSLDTPPPGTDDSRRLAPRRIHLRPARANVRLLQARHPETRAADAAACELAGALVLCRRPEEALEVLREVMPRLQEEDPLRARAEELAASARDEIRRKQERREQLQWGAPVLDTNPSETR